MKNDPTTQQVTICGPNLRTKGVQLHVHAAGCADLKHYGRGKKFGGDDAGWTIDATTTYETIRAIYADHASDYGFEVGTPEGDAYLVENYASEFKFFPCCKLAAWKPTNTTNTLKGNTMDATKTTKSTKPAKAEKAPKAKKPTKVELTAEQLAEKAAAKKAKRAERRANRTPEAKAALAAKRAERRSNMTDEAKAAKAAARKAARAARLAANPKPAKPVAEKPVKVAPAKKAPAAKKAAPAKSQAASKKAAAKAAQAPAEPF